MSSVPSSELEQFKRHGNQFNSRWGVINLCCFFRFFFISFLTWSHQFICFPFFQYFGRSFLFLITLYLLAQLLWPFVVCMHQPNQLNGFCIIVFIYTLIFHSIILVIDTTTAASASAISSEMRYASQIIINSRVFLIHKQSAWLHKSGRLPFQFFLLSLLQHLMQLWSIFLDKQKRTINITHFQKIAGQIIWCHSKFVCIFYGQIRFIRDFYWFTWINYYRSIDHVPIFDSFSMKLNCFRKFVTFCCVI